MITDFGTAGFSSVGETMDNLVGTLPFLAPELVTGSPASPSEKTDVWAFGMVIYVREMQLPGKCVNGMFLM